MIICKINSGNVDLNADENAVFCLQEYCEIPRISYSAQSMMAREICQSKVVPAKIKLELIKKFLSLSYFAKDDINGFGDQWCKYQLATFCLIFGRPGVAAAIFSGIKEKVWQV